MKPPSDAIDQIMAVMDSAFDKQYGEAWSRRQVEDSFLLGNYHFCLIDSHGRMGSECDGLASGFYLSRSGFGEEELMLLAVEPASRNSGIGRQLLTEFIDAAMRRGARRLLLEMRENNPAERLYQNAGFMVVGRRPQYYRCLDGSRIAALTFVKEL